MAGRKTGVVLNVPDVAVQPADVGQPVQQRHEMSAQHVPDAVPVRVGQLGAEGGHHGVLASGNYAIVAFLSYRLPNIE